MFPKKLRKTEGMTLEKQVRVRVADLIRQQYRARGIKRGEFAQKLGVTERTVGYWLDGTSQPKGELQNKIEEIFDWPKGAIAGAIAAGLSGTPVDEIRITQGARVGMFEGVPASVLADELLARLRAADAEVRSLKAQLEEAKSQLSQPDYSLAAHQVEPSMLERFAAEENDRGSLDTP